MELATLRTSNQMNRGSDRNPATSPPNLRTGPKTVLGINLKMSAFSFLWA
jgi:hypothetical protein